MLWSLGRPSSAAGRAEEEVSQSEAAWGLTSGQGVKCAPGSSPAPLPLLFFILSHL